MMTEYRRVLIYQSKPEIAEPIRIFFERVESQVWVLGDVQEALHILNHQAPDLLIVDLHSPGKGWLVLLAQAKRIQPHPDVIITNRHPDLQREMRAGELGARVFLREPFTQEWIEKAIHKLNTSRKQGVVRTEVDGRARSQKQLPGVRMPVRIKLTAPYTLLALVFVAVAVFLISRYVLDSMRDRFMAQLVDVGKLSADLMVQKENNLLEDLRLVANTNGVAEAIMNNDPDQLRLLILPLAINNQIASVDILNPQGQGILGLHHVEGAGIETYQPVSGDTTLASSHFAGQVLNQQIDSKGNKYAGLAEVPWGNYLYVSGPVYAENGTFVGVIAVGALVNQTAGDIRLATLAQVSLYDLRGSLISSTFNLEFLQDTLIPDPPVIDVLATQDQESLFREIQVGSSTYTEILGPWELRSGEDIGVIGVALPQNFILRPSLLTQVQAAVLVLAIFLGIVILGILLANQITAPLSRVAQAAMQIAQGNFEVKVPAKGNDEISVLAHTFNYMVSGLQEGVIYRDILGRTVSPEVREALRQSFASGDLRLEGQTAVATVLMSDIRGFTTLSEQVPPTTILDWLNEYFGNMVPLVTSHGGVVDKFEGDAMLAFFGLLPKPVSVEESAYQACQAAVHLLNAIELLNETRVERGEPRLITGIGINTGKLIAGGLGTSDRLNFTIIGDTVNTTQRLQEVTRDFGECGVVISEHTLAALGGRRGEFTLEPLGERSFKGKQELIWLYRLRPVHQPAEQRAAA